MLGHWIKDVVEEHLPTLKAVMYVLDLLLTAVTNVVFFFKHISYILYFIIASSLKCVPLAKY